MMLHKMISVNTLLVPPAIHALCFTPLIIHGPNSSQNTALDETVTTHGPMGVPWVLPLPYRPLLWCANGVFRGFTWCNPSVLYCFSGGGSVQSPAVNTRLTHRRYILLLGCDIMWRFRLRGAYLHFVLWRRYPAASANERATFCCH